MKSMNSTNLINLQSDIFFSGSITVYLPPAKQNCTTCYGKFRSSLSFIANASSNTKNFLFECKNLLYTFLSSPRFLHISMSFSYVYICFHLKSLNTCVSVTKIFFSNNSFVASQINIFLLCSLNLAIAILTMISKNSYLLRALSLLSFLNSCYATLVVMNSLSIVDRITCLSRILDLMQ